MSHRMDNDRMEHREPADDELARRLQAYAEARLSPELSAVPRMRAHLAAAAQRHEAPVGADAGRTATPANKAALADRRRRPAWRRPVTLLLAAGLTLGLGVGSVAAARPGGPLYGVRIWSETLTLPASAADRAEAELLRLEARLTEAEAATASGDTHAANAALEAFGTIVSDATTEATGNATASDTLDTGVRRKMEALTILAERVPAQARDPIKQAIDRSGSALDAMHGRHGGGAPETRPAKGSKPDVNDRSERTPKPNKATPDPADPTPKANAAPPALDAAPKPGKAPPPDSGRPTSPPGDGSAGQGD